MAKRIELSNSNRDLPKEWGAEFMVAAIALESTSKKG
jgi:hypothetical protein